MLLLDLVYRLAVTIQRTNGLRRFLAFAVVSWLGEGSFAWLEPLLRCRGLAGLGVSGAGSRSPAAGRDCLVERRGGNVVCVGLFREFTISLGLADCRVGMAAVCRGAA